MKRLALGIALGLALVASTAQAADTPDPRLDAAASEIAGHPTRVVCEPDPTDWQALLVQYNDVPPPGAAVPSETFPEPRRDDEVNGGAWQHQGQTVSKTWRPEA